ncbi:FHA domain-containing protein [Brevibacterium renqingii]|uniref:FHA domain-containing protein n=1 Tax=Brevibacterium renqingii TaxID=2776916 RepID=UPI001ADFD2B6
MSQNNDQNRPAPSQSWYDNGQVPQSKKFPFGAGNGSDESATRMNPQVDQNPQGSTPPYGQQPADDAPQAPQFGNGQNYGASQPGNQPYAGNGPGSQGQQHQPQGYGQPQGSQPQYGSNGAGHYGQPQGSQPQPGGYPQQSGQPQYGSNGAGQYGSNGAGHYGQPQGSQPQPGGYPQQSGQPQSGGYGQPQGSQPQSGQPQGGPGGGSRDQMSDSGRQQFQGILDPHTGEIHPVPDLDGLQEADALLVVVSGPDSGSQILLDTDVVTVGRSPNADIFLDDVTVSRKHAEFIRTPSGFTLRDTGSLNGTYVGRQLIDSIELQNGADVQIGKFRMIFQQRPRS